MSDPIERQAAIDVLEFGITYAKAINKETGEVKELFQASNDELRKAEDRIKQLPSAQPERRFDEWCTDCKEYDQEKNCCPRFNHVIRTTLQEVQEKGKWIVNIAEYQSVCSVCGADETAFIHGTEMWYGIGKSKFCPNCGYPMEVEK